MTDIDALHTFHANCRDLSASDSQLPNEELLATLDTAAAMASAPTRQLAQKFVAIAETWAKDPFRPNLELRNFLKLLAAHPKLTPQAVEATRALRDNTMHKKYRLSQKILRPASAPLHYERLVLGFEKSAQGIGRPWWKVFFGVW